MYHNSSSKLTPFLTGVITLKGYSLQFVRNVYTTDKIHNTVFLANARIYVAINII